MAEILVGGISNVFQENPCSISSLTFKGIRDEECPSMQREERKRPCKMNRETILRMLVNTFLSCPLQSLSIEANHFSASAVIELTQNISKGAFPTLSLLDIDGTLFAPLWSEDNNYNYDNVAMPRLMRIIQSIPRNIEVRSFYVETLSTCSVWISCRCDQTQPRRRHSFPVQLWWSIPQGLQVLLFDFGLVLKSSGADQRRGVRASDQVSTLSLCRVVAGSWHGKRTCVGQLHDYSLLGREVC